MDYRELARKLELDNTAVELKRRMLEASDKFLAAVKKYGSSEKANANTGHEADERKYFAMLQGYALAKTGSDWSVAFDAVSLFVYGEK